MSPEETAFRAALAATPEDETARLVFADWLMERSDLATWLRVLEHRPGEEAIRYRFADWLDEHHQFEDAAKQRAMVPGYRALVRLDKQPEFENSRPLFDTDCTAEQIAAAQNSNSCAVWWCAEADEDLAVLKPMHTLPSDWLIAIQTPYHWTNEEGVFTREFLTKPEAMDAAALAFARLPPERQVELLAQQEATA